MANIAFISLGSNLGDKQQTLEQAYSDLEKYCTIIKKSSFYITKPVGFLDQDDFLNSVVKVETQLNAFELLSFLHEIEQLHKRKRIIRFGPRTLDLDIITFNNEIISSPTLTIPHERLHERAFVLIPLAQIEENLFIPTLKCTVRELILKLDPSEIAGVKRK